MNRFTWTIAAILLITTIISTTSWMEKSVEASPGNQTLCPAMGFEINKELFTDYEAKRIYFCCPSCPPEFKKTPDTYMAKMKADGVILEDSPVHAS